MNQRNLRRAVIGLFLRCCAVGLLLSATHPATSLAQDAAAKPSGGEVKLKSEWNVRVEAVLIAVPEASALPLLPVLGDSEKVDSAYDQLLKLIEQKQATLRGYSIVHMTDGSRSVAESIVEKRYATEFEAAPKPEESKAKPAEAPLVAEGSPYPTTFETRNTGVTFEAEANVSKSAEWIYVNFVVQNVRLEGFDPYDSVKTKSGRLVKVDQPRFSTSKISCDLKLRNGQRCLAGVHKLLDSGDQIELTFIQVFATPTK